MSELLSTRRSSTTAVYTCPNNCKEAYAIAREEVDRIKRQGPALTDFDLEAGRARVVPGEIVRNGYITQAYTDLANDMPDNHWVRLASYVSVQGGCAMQRTQDWDAQTVGRAVVNPDEALEALGDANVSIFESIYPPNRMAANCGIDRFLECVEKGEIEVDPAIVRAMEKMRDGDLRGASDRIAQHEQEDVVQPVYERHKETFSDLQTAEGLIPGDQTSISIAKTCTRDNLVPLQGEISNPKHRVRYYEALIERLYEVEGIR